MVSLLPSQKLEPLEHVLAVDVALVDDQPDPLFFLGLALFALVKGFVMLVVSCRLVDLAPGPEGSVL